MPAQSQTTIKALGLNINPNFLDLPNGTLVEANDVIIRRENVIESRRGMSDWSEEIGSSTQYSTQLMEYKGRIIDAYSNKLAFETDTTNSSDHEIFDDFAGTYTSPGSYRIRSVESNKNLYFTTNNGIKKISTVTADDFSTASGYIRDAGAVKAIDFTAELVLSQGEIGGFLPVDSAVAYRHVWGYKDVNQNLILGAPSSRNLVYNFIQNALVMDLNTLLGILDIIGSGGSLISDLNYYATFALALNPTGSSLKDNTIGTAEKIDADLLFGTGTGGAGPLKISTISMNVGGIVTVTFTTGDPRTYISIGDYIKLAGITYATAPDDLTVFNDHFQVTNTTATTLQFIYTFPTGTVPYSIAAQNPGAGTTTLNSYNYTQIVMSGDDGSGFPVSLNDTGISSPITSGESATIQNTIQRIVNRLQLELPAVISATLITEFIAPYTITQSADTKLVIDIPTDSQGTQLNIDYFLQVYRSAVFNAFDGTQSDSLVLGTTWIPDDELHLIYEYFPTATDFVNGYITFNDSYPDSLAVNNTPLYTNPTTGDGILQSNNIPPFAQDINLFYNVIFYANTKTRHIIPNFQLLGVDNIVSGDKITIANTTTSSTYTFIDGTNEKTTFTISSYSKAAFQNKYFTINTANDDNQYYVWFRYDGSGVDPLVAGRTGIIVDVLTTDTTALFCQRTADTLNNLIFGFTTTFTATTFVTTNVDAGLTTNATNGNISDPPLHITITTQGAGEDAATGKVLISRTLSPAVNIDLTARSLIRVINRSTTSPVYAYYTSGDNTSPGQIDLEAKVLADVPFYVIASGPVFKSGNLGIGNSFNPDISPIHITTGAITTSGTAGYVTFNATAHALQNGFQVIITNTDSSPVVDGVYTVYNVTTNTFDIIHTALISPGTHFSWELTSDSVSSTNNDNPNRLYYSKFNQPDAVPALNYFDVGRDDKAILRIFPLRSSLFVFKEDGIYRISGQVAPFTVQLFDSSCILIAPDTVDTADNIIYAWSSQGISQVTESGTREISKPVDIDLFKLATYPNFKTLTWGVGYNSDNSYTVFTNAMPTDEIATLGYRYCTLTNTWTNIVRTQTCGIIRSTDDLLYMGSGTENLINQERKTYTRTDYADKDFTLQIAGGSVNTTGSVIQFPSVSELDIGDVLVQDQELTIYKYNNLLQQLDTETNLDGDYFSTLGIDIGDNLRTSIVSLAAKLDADSGTNTKTYSAHIADYTVAITGNSIANPTVVTTSPAHNLIDGRIVTITGTQTSQSIPTIDGTFEIDNTGTWGTSHTFTIDVDVTTNGGTGLTASTAPNSSGFDDIMACYNGIISLLNNDTGIAFSGFLPVTNDTPFEAVILDINKVTKKVTLNIGIQWVVGNVQAYKAIPCKVVYAPLTFGDVLGLKQIFQATVMFSNTAFTNSTLSFSSDLKPDYVSVFFNNLGNGIFGSYSNPGFGFGYFGGGGNAKPFRTYIPIEKQRCRFLNLKFEHQVAREIVELYGVTLTGNIQESVRAYR